MRKDDNVYLGHMLDMARKAATRVAGKTKTEFDADEDLRLVVAHLIQIIGEAASRVSSTKCQAYPEVPWRQIIGIRQHIVHGYMSVDYDILWQVATRQLPPLIEMLERIVPPEDQ